jgi:hypothetical protein
MSIQFMSAGNVSHTMAYKESYTYGGVLLWLQQTFKLKIDRRKVFMCIIDDEFDTRVTPVRLPHNFTFPHRNVELRIWEWDVRNNHGIRGEDSYDFAANKCSFFMIPFPFANRGFARTTMCCSVM